MQQLNHHITIKKRGLSPEETEEIVSSKVDQVFQHLPPNHMVRFRERKGNVMKSISYSTTTEGYMDRRRCSPNVWRNLGIIPAPANAAPPEIAAAAIPERFLSPENVNPSFPDGNYITYLCNTKMDSQKELFRNMKSDQKLDNDIIIANDGYLRKANLVKFSHVELCNALDEAAKKFVQEFHDNDTANIGLEEKMARMTVLKPMIRFCLSATISRIALTILFPDDIATENGHKKWKNYLELIASFATLTIALDLLGDQSCIPDNLITRDNENV
jgi:hypothetical protein